MRVIIYGASDDLLELEGDLREEFNIYDASTSVALSCGTLLRVHYDGKWSIRVTTGAGASRVAVYPWDLPGARRGVAGLEDVPSYSDVAVVEADTLDWAVVGQRVVRGS